MIQRNWKNVSVEKKREQACADDLWSFGQHFIVNRHLLVADIQQVQKPGSVMVWGSFSDLIKGNLHVCDASINAENNWHLGTSPLGTAAKWNATHIIKTPLQERNV